MLDSKLILNELEFSIQKLSKKGISPNLVKKTHQILVDRNILIQSVETLRSKKNTQSEKIKTLIKNKKSEKEIQAIKEEVSLLKENLKKKEKELNIVEQKLQNSMYHLPNFPDESSPHGNTPTDNIVIKEGNYNSKYYANKKFLNHQEIAEKKGILDQKRAAKISGSMFQILSGSGAKLLRALVHFAYQNFESDYKEYIVPSLVNSETFTGTGHLPKFANESYHIDKDDLWLIPTGEVPLTALHRNEVLSEEDLPLKYMTCTSCFRREAGSAGQETKGMQRLHEFHKVELVKITHPETSKSDFDSLVNDALKPIQALELPYRILNLCTGDLTFASAKTYDIEVYAPGLNQWLEVSSIGLFTDYQSRRSQIRFRSTKNKKISLTHTLNASGLATPRVWIAIIENYYQEDGRIKIPKALVDFMGSEYI